MSINRREFVAAGALPFAGFWIATLSPCPGTKPSPGLRSAGSIPGTRPCRRGPGARSTSIFTTRSTFRASAGSSTPMSSAIR